MEKFKLTKEGRTQACSFFTAAYYTKVSDLEQEEDEWYAIGIPREYIEEVEVEVEEEYANYSVLDLVSLLNYWGDIFNENNEGCFSTRQKFAAKQIDKLSAKLREIT